MPAAPRRLSHSDTDAQFSIGKVDAAKSTLRTKSDAALLAGFQDAAKSSDLTTFSKNIISIFSLMIAEER
ncbi:MAG: hypothetical protein MO846_03345 [Candidatus Devosia symbiotica]|nr:hypothetical protein [Candidatus Devosia symbiotica]